jgi:hypothetical protein
VGTRVTRTVGVAEVVFGEIEGASDVPLRVKLTVGAVLEFNIVGTILAFSTDGAIVAFATDGAMLAFRMKGVGVGTKLTFVPLRIVALEVPLNVGIDEPALGVGDIVPFTVGTYDVSFEVKTSVGTREPVIFSVGTLVMVGVIEAFTMDGLGVSPPGNTGVVNLVGAGVPPSANTIRLEQYKALNSSPDCK